jgi:hypothetical protein
MSYFKPDFDYEPHRDQSKTQNLDEIKPRFLEVKQDLFYALRECVKEIPDADLIHFAKATNLTFRTSTNVFDSVAFFRKFCDSYFFSIKKTFPNSSEADLDELKTKFQEIEKSIEKISKSGNVENKYLLPLLLGMLSGIVDYENY